MEKEIINYEIVNHKKDVVITYSLSDSEVLGDHDKVYLVAKDNGNKTFDLCVSSQDGVDLLRFKNLQEDILKNIANKRILVGGMSEETNEMVDVVSVINVSIEKAKKMKLGA